MVATSRDLVVGILVSAPKWHSASLGDGMSNWLFPWNIVGDFIIQLVTLFGGGS